jgi:hypothetical protein
MNKFNLIGATLNNLLIYDKLVKEGYECIIYEKQNKDDYFNNLKIIKKNMLVSSNDVNLLEWLKSININYNDVFICYPINFNFAKELELKELNYIFNLYNYYLINDHMINNLLKDEICNFSFNSINYITRLCNMFDKDYNIITIKDFIELLHTKLISNYYMLNSYVLYNKIFNYLNIQIKWDTEITNLNKFIQEKVIIDIKPERVRNLDIDLNSVNIKRTCFYNLWWENDILFPDELKTNFEYYYLFNHLYFEKDDNNDIENNIKLLNNKLFFLDKPNIELKYNEYLKENIINNNVIVLKKHKLIEDGIMNSLFILYYYNIKFKKIYKIYKNDSLLDIIKLYLVINFCLKFIYKI